MYKIQVQGKANVRRVAVGTGFLGDDTGGLADERQLIVGGERHDQDLTGLELLGSLGCAAADADFALSVAAADTDTSQQAVTDHVDLNHVGSTGNTNRNTGGDNDQIAVLDQPAPLAFSTDMLISSSVEWA